MSRPLEQPRRKQPAAPQEASLARQDATARQDAADEARPSRRYPQTIYVRATRAEKERIRARARACGLSLSRYLVAAAATGKAPPTEADRKRLAHLLFVFRRAETALRQVLGRTADLGQVGLAPGFGEDLSEASALLASLTAELSRQL